MNKMSAAFEKAGVHPRDAEFNLAIAKYLNSGGTLYGAQALLDAAKLMSADGHSMSASSEAWVSLPSDRQPIPGEASALVPSADGYDGCASSGKPLEGDRGQDSLAGNSLANHAPSPSSHRDGRGHVTNADDGHDVLAPSVREPSTAQRAASLNVAKISIMDSLKIDGRPYRSWGLAEAERAGRSKTRDGYILSASVKYAHQRYANLRGDEKLGDLIGEKQLQRFHQKAAEISDAA